MQLITTNYITPVSSVMVAGLSVCPSPALAQESSHQISGFVKAGAERDNNVERLAGDDTTSDLLTRYFANIDAHTSIDQTILFVTLSQGGKLFASTRNADTLLTQIGLGAQQQLSDTWSARAILDVKDRSEHTSTQDYLRGGSAVSVRRTTETLQLDLRSGWRYFIYKPNTNANARGPNLSASARVLLPHHTEVSTSYSWLQRRFDVFAYTRDSLDLLILSPDPRKDAFHTAAISARWDGPVLVNASYARSVNHSNSFGQNLLRHTAQVNLTAPLFWDMIASVSGQLQRTHYQNPVELDANFSVDEDNRNNLTLSLSKLIGEAWDAELRYSLYTQEFGVGEDYSRQTIMLAVGYSFDSED